MSKTEFLALFEEIVEEPPGTLTGSEKLGERVGGWTSLAIVSFIAMVDEKLGTVPSPRDIANCKTVNDLIGLLDGKVAD